MMRGIAVLLILAQTAAGCATAGKPLVAQAQSQEEKDRAECSTLAAQATDSKALKEGEAASAIIDAYLMLVGAADGAWTGAITGGSRSDGAWIGAAAGAGIGLIVGLVAGVKKGVERHRQYRETYDRCLTDRGYSV